MKKFFLFSIGLGLSFFAGITVKGALITDEKLLADLFDEAGITETYKNDYKELENLASDEQLPFEHLYLFMLQNQMNGPREAALKELAARTSYSQEELESILIDGSTETIISHKEAKALEAQSETIVAEQQAAQEEVDAHFESQLTDEDDLDESEQSYAQYYYETYQRPEVLDAQDVAESLTTKAILNEFLYLSDLYKEELEFQEENRKLAYEALASEIFMNNDLSDSADIDLLYDLDLMHYLLFAEYISYPDRSDGEDAVETASEEETTEVANAQEGSDDDEEVAVNVSERVVLAKNAILVEDVILAEDVVLAEESVDPYTCWEDDELAAALEDFGGYEGIDEGIDDGTDGDSAETGADGEGEGDEDSGGDGSGSEGSGGASRDDDGDGASSEGGGDEETASVLAEIDAFIDGINKTIGDWGRALPCGEIFCITMDLVTEAENPEVGDYERTENCIACHTTYIQERMEETLSHSLVPSKISMNWFEDATCKDAGNFVNLDLNVYAIKKPIDLDPDDETDDAPKQDIEDLKTRLWGIAGFPLPGASKTTLGKTLADQECESLLNLGDISGISRQIDDALADCQEQADTIENESAAAYEEFTFDTYAQSTSDLYGQVSAELYTMLLYFEGFQEALQDTYSVENAPLPDLLSTEYCQ